MITNKAQLNKLNKYNVVINTRYKSNNKILEKSSDGLINNDIIKGIILEKKYILNGSLNYKLNNFDPRIEYTFINNKELNNITNCPNCGARIKSNTDECEYCGAYYNIDYDDKDLGSKYHYDMTLHSTKYIVITFILDIIFSATLMFLYIYNNSRTFNIYDISKVLVGTIILSGILYYIFYLIDALIVLFPIKIYKQKENEKQIVFWNKMVNNGIDKTKFYNNLNYELNNYYFNTDNAIIDYDIIDYLSFNSYNKNNEFIIATAVLIREVYIENNKIKSKIVKRNFNFKRNTLTNSINGGMNIINCHNCGASIDVTSTKCDYCGTHNNYLQEWYLSR